MKYHGNYCGPNWSAGKHIGSVRYGVGPSAIDEFDETCRQHDDIYASGGNLKEADYKFFKENIGRGIKRSAAAIAVGAQGLFRSSQKNNNSELMAPKGYKRDNAGNVIAFSNRGGIGSKYKPFNGKAKVNPVVAKQMAKTFASKATQSVAQRSGTSGKWSGRSSGFISKGSKRKLKKNNKFLFKGVSKTIEYGGITNGVNAVFIGHATCATDQMISLLAQALIKMFLIKLGKMPKDPLDTIYGLPGGAVFVITYKLQYADDAITSVVIGTGAALTFAGLANSLGGIFTGVLGQVGNQVQLVDMQYSEGSNINGHVMHLKNAKVSFYVKSTLKVQNRTLDSGGGDTTDVVDNTPLYGKSYSGKGTGTNYTGAVDTLGDMVADRTYGVIDRTAGVTNSLQEPPMGKLFPNVNKQGKAKLDPGQIKTSSLSDYYTTGVNTFLRHIIPIRGGPSPYVVPKPYSKVGKFTFLGLEKMINPVTEGVQISIAWEHNYNIMAMIKPGHNYITTSLFENAFKG